MARGTGRLTPWPDDPSVVNQAAQTKWNGPALVQLRQQLVRGRADTQPDEGADMAESTRPPGAAHSRQGETGVKITPPTTAGPTQILPSTR